MWKKRKAVLFLFLVGIGYYTFVKATHISIPCMFRMITHFKCPGCGITTMIFALLQLNFERAYMANPFLFVTGPFLVAEVCYLYVLYEKERTVPKWNHNILIGYAVLLITFGVYRNIVHI